MRLDDSLAENGCDGFHGFSAEKTNMRRVLRIPPVGKACGKTLRLIIQVGPGVDISFGRHETGKGFNSMSGVAEMFHNLACDNNVIAILPVADQTVQRVMGSAVNAS